MTEPTVQLSVDTINGKSRCVAIQITAAPGAFLTGEELRRVPIAHLVAEAMNDSSPPMPPVPDGFPADGPTPEALRYIATAYDRAYAVGKPPTKAVENLGLTYPTAARWVALARAAGYLSRTTRGRVSGATPSP